MITIPRENVTSDLYPSTLDVMWGKGKTVRWATDDIRVALLSEDYVQQSTDETWNDVAEYRVHGGQLLSGKSIADAPGKRSFRAKPVKYDVDGAEARYAVLYADKDAQPLLSVIDFGESVETDTLTVTFPDGCINVRYPEDA